MAPAQSAADVDQELRLDRGVQSADHCCLTLPDHRAKQDRVELAAQYRRGLPHPALLGRQPCQPLPDKCREGR